MSDEVWVLGATGRAGKAIARSLRGAGVAVVLVGRDRGRLEGLGAELTGAPRLVVGSLQACLAELARDAPAVVVNTVGPFTTTARQVIGACPPGTHYVDIANELPAVESVLALGPRAAAARQVLVTGAGFGVLAAESVLLRLCEGRPSPRRVRVDSLASVATEAGVLGSALAATIVEILALGGREVRHGRVVRSRVAAHRRRLTTPAGEIIATGSGPSGELIAAWRASGADSVVAASSIVPTSIVARLVLPAVSVVVRVPGVARVLTSRMAGRTVQAAARPRPFSWAHARAEWADGMVREGWLRAGDGHDFTAAVAAEVTQRLLRGQGRPGAHTPGALFGAELAEAAGGTLLADEVADQTPAAHG